jgi:hypothetical protein
MIWQNPWAWAGLLTLALPVLIHLLGRRNARVLRFPTLRFLQQSPLLSSRRTRLNDLLLLAVRLAILLAAVAALAQPFLVTDGREAELGRTVARVIVVDTSASMSRPAAEGDVTVLEAARTEADGLAREASTSVVLETAAPAHALAGAAAWLGERAGRAEIVVLSDFQQGTLDAQHVADVPENIGLRLVKLEVLEGAQMPPMRVRQDGADINVTVERGENGTEVEWALASEGQESVAGGGNQAGAIPGSSTVDGLVLITAPDEHEAAASARRAATSIVPAGPVPMERPIAIIYPGAPDADVLEGNAEPINQRWMGEVIARMHDDATLRASAGHFAEAASAATGEVDGRPHLLLFSRTNAGSLQSAALIAAAISASSPPANGAEFDTVTIASDVLAGWEREAATRARHEAASGDAGPSDGRWLWLLALLLLGAETLIRRTRALATTEEPARERVAA